MADAEPLTGRRTRVRLAEVRRVLAHVDVSGGASPRVAETTMISAPSATPSSIHPREALVVGMGEGSRAGCVVVVVFRHVDRSPLSAVVCSSSSSLKLPFQRYAGPIAMMSSPRPPVL